MSINALNEEDLQIHSRQQLQKLARTHGVRANSKSTVIIKQLLEKFPEGVPSVSITPSKSSKRKLRGEFRTPAPAIEESHTEAQLPLPAANNLGTPSSILSSPPSSPQIRAAVLHATAEADASPQRPWPPTSLTYNHDEDSPENHESEEESNASSEYTNETDATPPSSRANSPQPPCSPTAVKHAIETMRQVSEKDSTLSAQVESLRTLADNLIHQAHQLSQVLRRERGTRQRILTYMTYYIPNNNRWGNRVQNGEILSEVQAAAVRQEYLRNGGRGWKDQGRWEFEEIWGGPFKYAQLPAERHGVEWIEVEEGEEQKILNLRARLEEEAKGLHEQQARDEIWRKRFVDRDGDEGEDETRYRPRRRLQAVEQLATESLVGLGVADKGKRKMTSDEMEALQQDQQTFSRLAEVDSPEMEERLARERMDWTIASRLAADENDREDQSLEMKAAIRRARDHAAHEARDLIHVVHGVVVKVATDVLSGAEQWDNETKSKKRDVLEIGLDRLGIIVAEDSVNLDIRNLAQLALQKLVVREGR